MSNSQKKQSFYYCSNYACDRRNECARFISEENPIEKVSSHGNCFLNPFVAGEMSTSFYPSNIGFCQSFVLKKDAKSTKNNHI